MLDPRPRNFSTAPPSITSLIATLLEPALTVLVYLAAMAWEGETIGRADLTLCFLDALRRAGERRGHNCKDRKSVV